MGIALLVILIIGWLNTREMNKWASKVERRLSRHDRFIHYHAQALATLAQAWGTTNGIRVKLRFPDGPFARHQSFVGLGVDAEEAPPLLVLFNELDPTQVLSCQLVREPGADQPGRRSYRLALLGGKVEGLTTDPAVLVDGALTFMVDWSGVSTRVVHLTEEPGGGW